MYIIFNLQTSLLFRGTLSTSLLEKKILTSKPGEVVCLQIEVCFVLFFIDETMKKVLVRKKKASLATDKYKTCITNGK